ncbi:MAG: hypothetical protein WB952_19300 [Terriglobales bacterium]
MRLLAIRVKLALALIAVLAITSGSAAFTPQTLSGSPAELVRRTMENEVKSNGGSARSMFRDHQENLYGSRIKLVVETREGTAGMLVEIDGKPLDAQQREAETERLAGLVNNPQELKRKQKNERDDTERTARMVRAFPYAFQYEFDGTEMGKPGLGKAGSELVRLKFRPDPNYDPPTHTEQVLTGMQGYLLIDANQHRIAKIDGTLFKDVGFGWGILGHLDKGGRFVVAQGDVGNGDWEVTRMDLAFTGRVLWFKKINIKSIEVFSDFRPAPPDLSFAQGVELLKKQAEELAENRQQDGGLR